MERKYWEGYMDSFEEMVRSTSTDCARWHVVPADHKWFTRLVVSSLIIEKLRSLDLHFPKLNAEQKKEMIKARAKLAGDKSN